MFRDQAHVFLCPGFGDGNNSEASLRFLTLPGGRGALWVDQIRVISSFKGGRGEGGEEHRRKYRELEDLVPGRLLPQIAG